MLNINRRRDFLQQMPYLHFASGNWWKNNDVNNNVHQAAIFWAGGYQTFGETCHHETSWGYSEALGSGSWNSETLDTDFDTNSISATVGGSSFGTSISSSTLKYRYENGRRYHGYHSGSYLLPNDEAEQERLDLHHHIFRLTLGGRLFRAPITAHPERVLDFGTATGIWAIDFADEFQSTTVIGNDLSPIQPSWIPPNCKFYVDDVESEWVYLPEEATMAKRKPANSVLRGSTKRILNPNFQVIGFVQKSGGSPGPRVPNTQRLTNILRDLRG
ncbi:uncharacterized protein PADG_11403 [Paracoccidioides brasiliensis Pb18]|uniref:Methyltransferase domain-containing protein n=1 Tax=Paracoccidioides brasiliensis (strain Pb18) TaxID=502780 RepID=A0A0A0HVF9_PARBD|nr:uncharacterized protein PADG_11403 [Paracoccidioides brasiliensis Pb18]KGM92572.1 hypothetical protein PADG_11403 [Paracoccidioides brasiliensis Pb18]